MLKEKIPPQGRDFFESPLAMTYSPRRSPSKYHRR
jgi:hypothetical protein